MGLSYLPQESSIFRGLSVEQNIFAALEQRKDLNQEENIETLQITQFNLKEFSKTLGIKLSGGERRRTEIARSLASNPKFILLMSLLQVLILLQYQILKIRSGFK